MIQENHYTCRCLHLCYKIKHNKSLLKSFGKSNTRKYTAEKELRLMLF